VEGGVPELPDRVAFGEFVLELQTGELRRGRVRINLSGQGLAVLRALLERPGELVTREELRRRLWEKETFVDFEHGVNAAVKRLRESLGDSAASPRFVETLPRRGYRFIAAVQQYPPQQRQDEVVGAPLRGLARLAYVWLIGAARRAGV
jgi:DNA-binding winged helix-turn-helix (wHTH) protein